MSVLFFPVEVASRKMKPNLGLTQTNVPAMGEFFVWERQIASQTTDVATKCFGKGAEDFERWIALSPFDSADIAGVYTRFKSQRFLRHAFEFACLTNSFSQNLQRSGFLQL